MKKMKKILLLLLFTIASYGQAVFDEGIKITGNANSATATKVNVQETDGTINTISKSDLVNVVEVNDVPTLPLVGEVGKIYVVKNVNKIYRWNGTFYQELAVTDISGLQAQLDLKANTSEVVKLTGNQTISGQKSFSLTGKIDMQTNNAFPAIMATAIGSNGELAAQFINNSSSPYSSALNLQTGSSGGVGNVTLSVLNQSPIGTGIVSNASNGGVSISSQSGDGDSYVSNIAYGGTGRNYVGRNNGIETYSVDKTGNVTATSFINSTAPANNILLAGGGDLAQGTAFNKNFGTTSGTVVEGNDSRVLNGQTAFGWGNHASAGYALTTGSNINQSSFRTALGLGSNAYSSTAYLPLTGGDVSGLLKVIVDGRQLILTGSDQGAVDLYKSGTLGHRLFSDAYSFGIYDFENDSTVLSISKATEAATFSSTVTATSFNGSATLTGTPTAPTATAGTNTTQIATTAFVLANSSARPYKVYTALLTQSGAFAPTATVLENTLGGSITWSRNSVGVYLGTLANGFSSTLSKVRVFISGGEPSQNTTGFYNALPNHINSVQVNTRNTSGSLADSLMGTGATIEIRVYN